MIVGRRRNGLPLLDNVRVFRLETQPVRIAVNYFQGREITLKERASRLCSHVRYSLATVIELLQKGRSNLRFVKLLCGDIKDLIRAF